MSNPSKGKGTDWETALVRFLGECGLPARRKVLAGNKDKGDVEVEGVPGVVIEAKNCKRESLAAWVDEAVTEAENAGIPVGVVWHRRRLSPKQQSTSPGDGYVTMTGEHFVKLLRELKRVRALESDLDWGRHH